MSRDDLFTGPAKPEAAPTEEARAGSGPAHAAGGKNAPGGTFPRITPDKVTSLARDNYCGAPLRRTASHPVAYLLRSARHRAKTSLAQIIARQTSSKFERLSGVESNVADMRRVLAAATNRLENKGQATILFVDEIHRFNKAQQDVLLPDVESGVIRLIGATDAPIPSSFVNLPLVSRSQIFELRGRFRRRNCSTLLQRASGRPGTPGWVI